VVISKDSLRLLCEIGCDIAEQDTPCSLLEHLEHQSPAEQNQDGSSRSLFATRSLYGNHEQEDKEVIKLFVSIITLITLLSRYYKYLPEIYIYIPRAQSSSHNDDGKRLPPSVAVVSDPRSHYKTTWVFPLFPPPPLLAFLD